MVFSVSIHGDNCLISPIIFIAFKKAYIMHQINT